MFSMFFVWNCDLSFAEASIAKSGSCKEPDFPCDRLGDKDETAGWKVWHVPLTQDGQTWEKHGCLGAIGCWKRSFVNCPKFIKVPHSKVHPEYGVPGLTVKYF